MNPYPSLGLGKGRKHKAICKDDIAMVEEVMSGKETQKSIVRKSRRRFKVKVRGWNQPYRMLMQKAMTTQGRAHEGA